MDSTEPDAQNISNYLPLFYLPAIQHLWLAIDNPRNGDFQWPFNHPPVALGLQIVTTRNTTRATSCTDSFCDAEPQQALRSGGSTAMTSGIKS